MEEVEDGRLLRLRAEMRLPGLAWLELRVDERADGATVFHQRATFHPHGLSGRAYWLSVLPFHGVVFGEMQRNVARAAEALERRHPHPGQATPEDLRAVSHPLR